MNQKSKKEDFLECYSLANFEIQKYHQTNLNVMVFIQEIICPK